MTAHTPLCAPVPCALPALPAYNSERDITETWLETFDPENEIGAICTAYFEHEPAWLCAANNAPTGRYGDWPQLVAISIDTGEGPTFHGPEWVLQAFGGKWFDALESAQFDTVNGW